MGLTAAQRRAKERAERHAAWEAEEKRIREQGDLFEALPEGHQKAALLDAMISRIIHLWNNAKFEYGDAILEFLPNNYARELLDWYFDENGPDTFTPKAATAEYEITQPRKVQSEPQESGGTNGQYPEQENAEDDMNVLHESRVVSLREAYDAGLSLRGAAAKCGIQKTTVERYYRRWKSEDFGGEMCCLVKGETKRRWREEADKRQMSVRELHAYVIDTIAEDNLFDAVMG